MSSNVLGKHRITVRTGQNIIDISIVTEKWHLLHINRACKRTSSTKMGVGGCRGAGNESQHFHVLILKQQLYLKNCFKLKTNY